MSYDYYGLFKDMVGYILAFFVAVILGTIACIAVVATFNENSPATEVVPVKYIYTLEMGETGEISHGHHQQWTRVPGGWVVRETIINNIALTFVPWSEEGRGK